MDQHYRLARIAEGGIALQPSVDERGQPTGPLVCPVKLPLGDVQVSAPNRPDLQVADFATDVIRITVLDLNDQVIAERTVVGRQGLNELYESVIGYRPLDDAAMQDHELLCITAEVLYRAQTGDDA
ncbi:MAG: hypothetical protein KGZ70_13595 [Hydrogenophaga sp.]|nr:hypothetical protein [Hydrogenophaga sp.]